MLQTRRSRWVIGALVVAVAAALSGCTPSIGDKCTLSTDCSIQGTRLCDTSQTAGYCTITGCTSNSCPDNAACVEFGASIPGCPYEGYRAPSRAGRSMCMKACSSDSDCRQGDGYVCRDPHGDPWQGVLLDSSRSHRVCIAAPGPSAGADAMPPYGDGEAPVCSANRPPLVDAEVVSTPDGDAAEPGDGSGIDADDAAEASAEAAAEDAPLDGVPEAAETDAPDGG